jgi:hypothetical protein
VFLELTEALRCPNAHDESYLICAPVAQDGRDVVRGGLLCPVCRSEFAILDRVAWLAPPDESPATPSATGLTADAIATFLQLDGPGGYVILAGAAGREAPALAERLPNVVLAVVNGPRDLAADGAISIVHSPRAWPFRRHSVRGAVLGADAAREPWLAGAVGSVLHGLRVIVEDEAAEPDGLVTIARGAGILVGEKRAR